MAPLKGHVSICNHSFTPFTYVPWQMSEEVRTALERAELEDPGEILRFPLSMGDLRMDRDHSGEACHVLDIVFNRDVLKQAQTFRSVTTLSPCLPGPGLKRLHSIHVSSHPCRTGRWF